MSNKKPEVKADANAIPSEESPPPGAESLAAPSPEASVQPGGVLLGLEQRLAAMEAEMNRLLDVNRRSAALIDELQSKQPLNAGDEPPPLRYVEFRNPTGALVSFKLHDEANQYRTHKVDPGSTIRVLAAYAKAVSDLAPQLVVAD